MPAWGRWRLLVVEPRDEGSSTVSGSSIGTVIGPALLESADEALGFAIGTGRVGASVEMSDAVLSAGTVEAFGDVAAAVVGHNTLDGYAARVEEGHSTLEELGTGVLVFLGHHLDVGDPAVVIHSNMCELPPAPRLLRARSPWTRCPGERYGRVSWYPGARSRPDWPVRTFVLVVWAPDPGVFPRLADAATVTPWEAGTDSCAEISQAVSRCRRNLRILCTTPAGVCRGLVCGRSSDPQDPLRHLLDIFGATCRVLFSILRRRLPCPLQAPPA